MGALQRLQFDVSESMLQEIEDMMEVSGMASRKELFNSAITLWQWAIEQVRRDREIVSANKERDDFEILRIPTLEAARKKRPNKGPD